MNAPTNSNILSEDALELIRTLLLEELQRAAEILAELAHEAHEVKGSCDGEEASWTLRGRVQVAADVLDAIGWAGPDMANVESIPTDPPEELADHPEELERWHRDPVEWDVRERLHDAGDELRPAIDELVNALGMSFELLRNPEMWSNHDIPERLSAAGDRVKTAERVFFAAVARTNALLQQRQKGGE